MIKYLICSIDEIAENDYKRYFYLMPPERQKKCLSYARDCDKKLCIAAYILLCRLSDRYEIKFTYSKNGKPEEENNQFFFSLSHSGQFAAAVLSDRHVGIDIEVIRPVSKAVINRVCTKNELATVYDGSDVSFYKIWTFKEAYFKKEGTGLSAGLKSVDISDYCDMLICKVTEYFVLTII